MVFLGQFYRATISEVVPVQQVEYQIGVFSVLTSETGIAKS